MTTVQGLLNHLNGRLREAGIAFAIGGSFALAARGIPRLTNDMDIMAVVRDLAPLHQALAGGRFGVVNEVTFQDAETGLYLDIHPVEDEAQEWAFETATLEALYGAAAVRVISTSGIILMLLREATLGDPKRRPLRLRDIELLAVSEAVDWEPLRDWATRMGYEAAYRSVQAEGKPPL